MGGVMHRPITLVAVGTAETAVSQHVSTALTSVGHGRATIVSTQMLVKTPEAVTAQVMPLTSVMVGAMHRPTTLVAAGMAAIAVSLHVLMVPTRVALWDTLATIQTPVKTVQVVALKQLGINLTSRE